MKKSAGHRRQWRIGELAEAAGMTVRALHHYEDAGLLTSAGRTEGGHRMYDEAAVERLYRIRALRGLGLSLDHIRKTIDDGAALAGLLYTHLARVELQAESMTRLRDRLRGLTKTRSSIGADDLLATLDAMSHVERHATHAGATVRRQVRTRRRSGARSATSCAPVWMQAMILRGNGQERWPCRRGR